MKILRIFGIVAAVHFFAFVFIMANPGCSTKSKSQAQPLPSDSMASAPLSAADTGSPFVAAPSAQPAGEQSVGISFDPHALAGGSRFSPTRPGTPASSAALQPEAPVEATSVPATVTVGKGDSLWSIAKKQGIPVTELASANHLKTSAVLSVGQKLVLPGKTVTPAPAKAVAAQPRGSEAVKPASTTEAVVPATAGKPAGKAGTITHIVKPGEPLAVIARKYGVKMADIAVANNITNPALIPAGKELIIPIGKPKAASTTTKPAASAAEPTATEPVATQQPAAQPAAPAKPQRLVMPVIGDPSASEDLDAGLAPAGSANVPVIRIEEDPNAPRQ